MANPPSTDYTWKHIGPAGYRFDRQKGYGWWVSLAILLSLMMNIGMFFMFNQWEIKVARQGLGEEVVFNLREQATVSEKTMRELLAEEAPKPKEVEPKKEKLIDDVLEEMKEIDKLPLKSLTLSPETEKIQSNLRLETPAPMERAAVDTSAKSIDFGANEGDLTAMKKKLLEPSGTSAAMQPKIMVAASDNPTGVDTEGALKKMMADAGNPNGAAQALAKFTSLDKLVDGGEPLPADSTTEIIFPTDLLFDFNQSELKEHAKLSLMKLGFLIVKYPTATFHIKGYSDSIGGQESNLALSQKRAEAVANWVVNSLRLEGYKLEAKGYGKLDPLVPQTGDKDEEALNRRVEIEIIQGE